jgi:cation diffusion facilitator family transporter
MAAIEPQAGIPSGDSAQEPRRAEGDRVAHQAHRLSLATNAVLAVMKLVAGGLLVSPALVADGWHSFADTISSAVAWIGFRLGKEPADEDHHYGHGNLEALAGLLVGLALVVGGALILWRSLRGEHEVLPEGGSAVAMSVALVSALVNLGLASVTHRASKRVASLSLRALTLDNLGDALSSVIVLVAIFAHGQGYPSVELFVAGAIGVVIAAMGIGSVRSGFDVLMVRVTDQTLRVRIAESARCVEGVRGVQNVRIHPLGSDVRVDLEVNVDGQLTVAQGHDIAHEVESRVTEAHSEVRDVHVHVNPCLPNPADSPLFPGFGS